MKRVKYTIRVRNLFGTTWTFTKSHGRWGMMGAIRRWCRENDLQIISLTVHNQ